MLPFVDLKAQYRRLEPEIRRRMDAVLEHGRFVMGPEIQELEERLAEFVGVPHALACSSGTDALMLPLMALGIGPGDAVLTTPFTFFATAEVIALVGATPVFVDIDPDTFNMDPDRLADVLDDMEARPGGRGPRPRAVMPVDLFGLPCDHGRIQDLARARGLDVIEDAAQGLGGRVGDRMAGSFGIAAGTSFFPAKPLGCYGDGGAVFTSSGGLHETMASLRVHGQGRDRYDNERIGLNARMDTLQAAVLLPKLAVFAQELKARGEAAKRYQEGLSGLAPDLVLPKVPYGMESAWAQYSVLARNPGERARITAGLEESGVPTAIYYPRPLHLQKAFAHLGGAPGDFPVAEEMSGRIFSLPMHPYLEKHDQDRVIEALAGLVPA